MKILFSFESTRMPLRSVTLIKWLIHRGHEIHVLYNESICDGKMEGKNLLKNIPIITHVDDVNLYDIWILDVLNHKRYGDMSAYSEMLSQFKNEIWIISFDDGSDFFSHRLNSKLQERVSCWLNNLLEKDLENYISPIREKCMLIPTYIESSNELRNIYHSDVKPFLDKTTCWYFSGAITGCIPSIDCRVNSINVMSRSVHPYNIRVTGYDPSIFLKFLYDNMIDINFKKSHVSQTTYINEINNSKFVLSPKGNCQPLRRQYESFAFNNLVFINENNTVDYLCEGIPGIHFVSYNTDCSDLKEKLRFYGENLEDANKIANAGRQFWETNCRIYPSGEISKFMSDYLVNKIYSIIGINV